MNSLPLLLLETRTDYNSNISLKERFLWGGGGFSLYSRDQSPACAEQDTIGLLTDNSSNMPDFDSQVR